MNIYKEEFRFMPVTLLFHNTHTFYSVKLKNSLCFICAGSTTIPFGVCSDCSHEFLGFKVAFSEHKGHHLINTWPRQKNQIWDESGVPEVVSTYFGDICSKKEIDARYGSSDFCFATYAIQLAPDVYIDACRKRCLLSLLNSDNTPNCEFIIINNQIYLKFIKDIEIGEELVVFYDYGQEDKSKTYQPQIILI